MGLDQPAQRPRLEVAHGDQERVVRGEVPAVVGDDLVAGQRAGRRAECRADPGPADARRRPARGRSARRDRPGPPGRSGARPGSAAWPSRAARPGRSARRTTSASSSRARGRSSARIRSDVQAGLTSIEPPTSSIAAASSWAERVRVPSSSSRPVRYETPGRASRSQPASTYSSRATTPVPGRALVDDAQSIVQPRPARGGNRPARDLVGNLDRGQARALVRRRGRFRRHGPATDCRGPTGPPHVCRHGRPDSSGFGRRERPAAARPLGGRGSDQPTVRFVSAR